ncbi:MAG: nucleotidyltransferase family protein [Lachnospiraceae bacterium]|nr:nucleotidyltransferase family protein [Lachnospiraceae bacterium]
MNTTAIIAEYNPFHNGHSYQLEKAKETAEADFLIVVMSGDYVQRGIPAIIDKYARAEMALSQGADLVIELPLYYCLGSLEYFAGSAVSLLDRLHIVDSLCFGSESGRLDELKTLAEEIDRYSNEDYKELFHQYIREGLNFPAAQEKALIASGLNAERAQLIREPNNALGVAYLRALKERHSAMKPFTVKRIQAGYHDAEAGSFSATAVRKQLLNKEALFDLALSTPEKVLQIMVSQYNRRFPVVENDFSAELFYKLHSCYTRALQRFSDRDTARRKALTEYLDIHEELSSRILSTYKEALDFDDLCQKAKSKDVTYTRISRALMHVLLDIRADALKQYIADDYHYYVRILGFRDEKRIMPLTHALKQSSELPLITKLADADKQIASEAGRRMLYENIQASDLYEKTACKKYRQLFRSEYVKNIVKY